MIDVSHFQDGDTNYLIYKTDDNSQNKPAKIYIRAFDFANLSFLEEPTLLISADREYEKNVVEGPWMIKTKGFYYLFYSVSGYGDPMYAVGVARSEALKGPYEKSETPVLHTDWNLEMYAVDSAFEGPGHCSVIYIQETGTWWMVYHSWLYGKIGQSPGRVMLADPLAFTPDKWPYMKNGPYPSFKPQGAPLGHNWGYKLTKDLPLAYLRGGCN